MIPSTQLSALPSFLDVPRDVTETLASLAIETRHLSGELLFAAGTKPRGWYVILQGRVRVVRGAGTRQHVVHTETAGGTLGEVPLFAGGTHPATGIAAEPTICALFTRAKLEAAIAANSGVAFLLLRRLADRTRALVDRLDDRSARSVQARLAEFLLNRRAATGNVIISVGLTQQQLAEELGTVREVVSRELRILGRAGLVATKGGGRYELRDLRRLQQLTGR
jgi:CRP/FNR family transcriptional regulator